MQYTASELFLWFIIYSFIGWVYETVLCSICQKTFVNRGFLNGPLCPIYGSGALIVILLLGDLQNQIVPLFLSGFVLTTVLEYLTSYCMEKLFHAKWWDYSSRRFNVNGRVCLLGSTVFGIMTVIIVKWVHPKIAALTGQISINAQYWWSAALAAVVLLDLFFTVKHSLTMHGRLREIQNAMNEYKEQSRARVEQLRESLNEKFENSKYHNERIRQLLNMRKFQDRRLLKAFPHLKSISYNEALDKLKNRLKRRNKENNS